MAFNYYLVFSLWLTFLNSHIVLKKVYIERYCASFVPTLTQLLYIWYYYKIMDIACWENYVKFIDDLRIYIHLLLNMFFMLGNYRKTSFTQLFTHRGPNNVFIPLWLNLKNAIMGICDSITIITHITYLLIKSLLTAETVHTSTHSYNNLDNIYISDEAFYWICMRV